MHRKLIRGRLFASNTDAINDPNIPHELFRDMGRNYLRSLTVWDREWGEKGIEFKRSSPVLRGREDAMTFITNLNTVLQLPAAMELNLSGEIRITIETDTEPLNFRVFVENGKVSYQEADYIWTEKTPFSG